jgi:hypothetical protein
MAIYTTAASAVTVQCPVSFQQNISILSIMEKEISPSQYQGTHTEVTILTLPLIRLFIYTNS